MIHIWNFFVKRASFSILLLVALILAGAYSLVVIPKESNPEVQVPIGIVTTVFPGASAEDIEKLVTNKIEEQLSGTLDGVKTITSSSQESVSSIVVEFDTSANIRASIDELKDEVDKAKKDLPSEAEDPVISDVDFSDEPILLISIASDLTVPQLITLTDQVVDELKTVQGVSDVDKSGIPDHEVQIVVQQEALDTFNIRLVDVIGAISRANSALPVGAIQIAGVEYTVKFDGDIADASEIADIAILNNAGEPVYIRDIAFVSDGISKPTSFSRVSIDGGLARQAISLSVRKQAGGDITRIADAVKERLTDLEETILKDTEVLISFDVGEFIKEDLRRLSLTGLQTVLLVMLILLLAIGWREALIAGMAIPLSFLISFIGLNNSGNTINFVSLFSLILAIGILVDSAIVITEGIHLRIHDYPRRRHAALATIKEFHWPLTSGTMTTIAVFAPLFIVSGITGEFIASIPFTIIFVLVASLIVALGFMPLLAAIVLRRKNEESPFAKKQERYTRRLQSWYRKKLDAILGNRKRENIFLTAIIILLVISIALPITGAVKTIFFADDDADFVFIDIETPEGNVLSRTNFAVRLVEDALYLEPRIESFVTTVGAGSAFTEGKAGSKFGNITVILEKDRKEKSTEIVEDIRKNITAIKGAEVRITQAANGPPTGAPVLIKFLGDDLEILEALVLRTESILQDIPGTVDISRGTKDDGLEFVLSIDRAKASAVGLDSATIAQTLRASVNGITASTLKTQGEDIDIVVKLDLNANYIDPHDTARTSIDALRYIQIETQHGPVLLGSFLDVSVAKSNAVIRHEDRKRIASISSELTPGTVLSDVVSEFESHIPELEIPPGVELKIGGETEDVDQSFKDMFVALVVGILLIMTILVLQFNSYRQMFFIIAIVPFTLIGILIGLFISGQTLSFPSMMGFIALAGIVVNNSIILIDRMNKLRKENPYMPIRDVVSEGTISRLRPILLTTLTTVIGIIPLTYASALWSPLAFSIIFGLSFAVIITLLLIPILYNRWPGKLPDEVEPAPQKGTVEEVPPRLI